MYGNKRNHIFLLFLCSLRSWNCHAWTIKQQTLTLSPVRLYSYPKRSTWKALVWSVNDPNFEIQEPQSNNVEKKEKFWTSQKELALALSQQTKLSLKQEQNAKFEKRRNALVIDTIFISWFIFCGCWMTFDNPMTAISHVFGASMGIAYTYGLGKSVEVLGQSIDDVGATQGAGVGEARFAFLILLFLFVGKFRGGEFGLQEIPSIAGFFTYQIASLNQGLRQIND